MQRYARKFKMTDNLRYINAIREIKKMDASVSLSTRRAFAHVALPSFPLGGGGAPPPPPPHKNLILSLLSPLSPDDHQTFLPLAHALSMRGHTSTGATGSRRAHTR
jgi:hypothetical protein